ncbi:MAG: transglutaminase-like domain-containing protein, partial [Syntrophales bacterium]|nr:transglutaminase-like domain-containing protein [Syntrophales bacterium]
AVLKEKGILGITLEEAPRQEALEGVDQGGSADLTDIASIPSNKTIDDPETIGELRVKLNNLGEEGFFLNSGRQALQKNVLTIRKETLPVMMRRGKIGKESPSLKPSPLIQCDHPLIAGKAREIVSESDGDEEKARKIVTWVNKNVKKRPVLSVPNALETLSNLVGDCNEHAVLVAALARAAGIPAEVEAGLVYLRGRFYYHAWNVLYLGDWITADAVLGQMPADVTHIRFVRGGVERQMDLLGLIGRLRVEVLDDLRATDPDAPHR